MLKYTERNRVCRSELAINGSPVVSDAPWGYQIVNDTSFFACRQLGVLRAGGIRNSYRATRHMVASQTSGPALGVYTDFIANNLTIVAPNSTAMQGFDLLNQFGIGEYSISPTATLGSTGSRESYYSDVAPLRHLSGI